MENNNESLPSRRTFLKRAAALTLASLVGTGSAFSDEPSKQTAPKLEMGHQNGKPVITAFDFDNDGTPDKYGFRKIEFYTSDNNRIEYHNQFVISRGKRNGEYDSPITAFDFGTEEPLAIKIKALDKKGNVDLVYLTKNKQGNYEVRVAKGHGDGTFGEKDSWGEFSKSKLVKDYGKKRPKSEEF
jgi:hypothetical protein